MASEILRIHDRRPTDERTAPAARLVALLALTLVITTACATRSTSQAPDSAPAAQSETTDANASSDVTETSASRTSQQEAASTATLALENAWGIKDIVIRRTSAGYMLDFRFRVMDPERAAPLFDRAVKPYLIHQASNRRSIVPTPPKTGPLRTSNPPKSGKSYWMFFANPGAFMQPGDKVTVVIGDFRVEDLVVE
jgi:hypothetical protein